MVEQTSNSKPALVSINLVFTYLLKDNQGTFEDMAEIVRIVCQFVDKHLLLVRDLGSGSLVVCIVALGSGTLNVVTAGEHGDQYFGVFESQLFNLIFQVQATAYF